MMKRRQKRSDIYVKRQIGFGDHTPTLAGDVFVNDAGEIVNVTRAQLFKTWNEVITNRDGEWCGMPVPLPGLSLVLEDKHPKADLIRKLQEITDQDVAKPSSEHGSSDDEQGWEVVNAWFTTRYHGDITGTVHLCRHQDGRIAHFFTPDKPIRNGFIFSAFETIDAWDLDTELNAMDRLSTLLSERMFSAYVLTGQFLERSKRSNLHYLFRRLRPTMVLTPNGSASTYFKPNADDYTGNEMRILTTLCLHPLGYYASTRCGAMVPTDDVIAHLMMMRGDEAMFWRRANHHSAMRAESGL